MSNGRRQSKSRNGCITCKKRRMKCDEVKPSCLNCQKKNIECGGYKTNFKWMSFEDTNVAKKVQLDKVVVIQSRQSALFDEAIEKATTAIMTPSQATAKLLPISMKARSLSTPVIPDSVAVSQFREFAKLIPLPEQAFDPGHMRRSLSFDSGATTPILANISIPAQITAYEFEKIHIAFENYTSGIMTIKTDPKDNPWKTMIWPFALENPVLFKAVASMSIFHVYKSKDEPLMLLATKLFRQSLGELAEGLTSNNITSEIALATCLVLAIAEGWDIKSHSSGIIHLKGAKSIMKKLTKDQIISNPKFYKFLMGTFFYYDVLIRMSNSLTVNENDQDGLKLLEYIQQTLQENDREMIDPLLRPLFDENLIMISGEHISEPDLIDPLLGVSRGLFIILGKVATFISKVRKLDKLSLSIVSAAVELKHEISSWKPDLSCQELNAKDAHCDLPSCITTAEAYRFSTILYLQQVVPEISSESSEELANKVLMLIASIPADSKTNTVHIFPLLIASCETADSKDREWILKRWETLRHLLNLGNIDKAVEIMKEVWRRKDLVKERKFKDIPSEFLANEANWDHLHGRIGTLIGSKKRTSEGINSWTHWSTVMKEWKWEVMFG